MRRLALRTAGFAVLASLALWACREREARKAEEPLPATFEKRIERYFDLRTDLFGSSQEDIVSKLGRPQETRVERIPNRHQSEVIDEIVEMLYDGLSIRLYRANYSTPAKEFVYIVTVTGPGRGLPWGLDVGSTRARAREILGPPARTLGLIETYDVLHFDPDGRREGYEDQISLTYGDDVVRAIQFLLVID